MGRTAGISFSHERGGFYCTFAGRKEPLFKCHVDDRPFGPNARRAMERLEELRAGVDQPRGCDMTVRDLLDTWLASPHFVNEGTRRSYSTLLRPWSDWMGGRLASDVVPGDLSRWLDRKTRWACSTRKNFCTYAKAFFGWALSDGKLADNPLADWKIPASAYMAVRGNEYCIGPALGDLLVKQANPALAWLMRALRATGARPIELLSAEHWHYHPDERAIIFRADARRGYIWKNARKRKSGMRDRVIFLPSGINEEVAERARGKGWLFTGTKGQRIATEDADRRFADLIDREPVKGWLEAKGIDPYAVVLYGFRHAWITKKLLAGVPIKTVADGAGTSVREIERTYAHTTTDMDSLRRSILGE